MPRLMAVSCLVGGLLVAACGAGDGGSAGADTAAATSTIEVPITVAGTAAPTTTSTTTAPTTTSVPPTTTGDPGSSTTAATTSTLAPATGSTAAPSTTTAARGPAALLLTDSGIGSVSFGTPDLSAIEQLSTLLGAPTEDRRAEFPTADGSGSFVDADDVAFVQPFGRFVCFANEWCMSFGGPTPDALVFLGWQYQRLGEPRPPELFTAAGLGIGVSWAGHEDDITMSPGASCYSVGYGSAGGISVTLLSVGVPFGSFDDNGVYVESVPPADQVTITSLTAGENEFFLFGDC